MSVGMSLEVGGMVSINVKNKYSERRALLRKAVICSFRRGISGFWQVVRTFVPARGKEPTKFKKR